MDLLSADWFIDAEIMIQGRQLNLNYPKTLLNLKKSDSHKFFIKSGDIAAFIVHMVLY